MKKLLYIFPLILIFLLASCTSQKPAPADPGAQNTEEAAPTAELTEAPSPEPTAPGSVFIENGDSPIALPKKDNLTPEEQVIADEYYELMKEAYPEFAAIPRERLKEWVNKDDKDIHVKFTYSIGGTATYYECEFFTSPMYPEGHWYIYGEDFAQFSECAVTEEQIGAIKAMLADSINEYVNENHLSADKLEAEKEYVSWSIRDGKLCAMTESIAGVTDETTESYGCIDHAHVFGCVTVEFTESGVILTDTGAIGS